MCLAVEAGIWFEQRPERLTAFALWMTEVAIAAGEAKDGNKPAALAYYREARALLAHDKKLKPKLDALGLQNPRRAKGRPLDEDWASDLYGTNLNGPSRDRVAKIKAFVIETELWEGRGTTV